jgi:hypothetical protein
MSRNTIRASALALAAVALLSVAGCYYFDDHPSSSNAYLSGLVPSGQAVLVPAFDADVTEYTISWTNAAGGISFIPTAANSGATITIDDAYVASGYASDTMCLGVGETVFTILVTAANGYTTRAYTVTVTADSFIDDFERADTTGLDLGTDWTVAGGASDVMRISTGCVYSQYQDTTNADGISAAFNGDVDYTGTLSASTAIYLSAAAVAPTVVGGIRINADPVTGGGYLCEIENDGSAYKLKLSLFTGSRELWTETVPLTGFGVGSWYVLKVESLGSTLTATLCTTGDSPVTCGTATHTEAVRTYSTGGVAVYNYVTNASLAPLGYALFFDDVTIERSMVAAE